jgi:hypothetical protein
MIFGIATYVGAVIVYVVFIYQLNKKLIPKQRILFLFQLVWVLAGISALVGIWYCIIYNHKVMLNQPVRIARALIDAQVTDRRAEKDLKDMPPSAKRQELAQMLRTALTEDTVRLKKHSRRNLIISVLVTWHDQAAIPFISEAQTKGYISLEDATKAIESLQIKQGA